MKQHDSLRNTWIITFWIATKLAGTCSSQETPLYNIPKFSNRSVPQDFCSIHRSVDQGKIERRNALRGLSLSTALFSYQLEKEFGSFTPTAGIIDEVNPDITILLLDELALRAGFEWRNSYGVVDGPAGNETWTDVLTWTGRAYDLVGEWFIRSRDRVELGVLFTEGIVDASLIMVKNEGKEKTDLRFFNFMAPFTNGLWGLILVTLVVSGLFYHLIDYLDSRRLAKKMDLDCRESIFVATWMFTGHTLHNPKSTATRLLVLSLSFLCLLTVSAYTANLVSFLVARNEPIVIKDINDAITNDLDFCVEKNGPNHEYMMRNYPSAKIVPIEEESPNTETYRALARSECDILLTETTYYERNRKSSEYNPNCNIEWVGREIDDRQGCYPIMDSSLLCSSLVSEVLTLHLLEMKNDKTFYYIWQEFLSKSETGACTAVKEQNEDSEKLNVANMFGIFVLHFALMFALLCWSLYRLYCCSRASEPVNVVDDVLSSMVGDKNLKQKASLACLVCGTQVSEKTLVVTDPSNEKAGNRSLFSNDMVENFKSTSRMNVDMCETLKKVEENMSNMNQQLKDLQKEILEKKKN